MHLVPCVSECSSFFHWPLVVGRSRPHLSVVFCVGCSRTTGHKRRLGASVLVTYSQKADTSGVLARRVLVTYSQTADMSSVLARRVLVTCSQKGGEGGVAEVASHKPLVGKSRVLQKVEGFAESRGYFCRNAERRHCFCRNRAVATACDV